MRLYPLKRQIGRLERFGRVVEADELREGLNRAKAAQEQLAALGLF